MAVVEDKDIAAEDGSSENAERYAEALGLRIALVADSVGNRSILAQRANISEATLYRYLSGITVPTADRLVALADAGQVSVAWLATGQGPMRRYDESEAPAPGEFSYVPQYNVSVSAGEGAFTASDWIQDRLAFRTDWLRHQLRADPKELAGVTVEGASMQPTLSDGDVVLVDVTKRRIEPGNIYVIRFGDELKVKRVTRAVGGNFYAVSDNKVFPRMPFSLSSEPPVTEIVGRVVWLGHKL